MRRIINLALVILVVFLSTSCATIFGGNESSRLTVESDTPLKVKVISDEGEIVTRMTPFTVDMDRSQTYTVRLVSDKYESSDIHIGRKLRGLAIANLLCLLCWIIDLATGNAYTHKQHSIYIDTKELSRKTAKALEENKSRFVARVDVTITGTDPKEKEAVIKTHSNIEFSRV